MAAGIDEHATAGVDDTIIEVHGYAKQGAGFGYTRVRGLNALIATISTARAAPVIAGSRLRQGSCGSPRGAARLVADTLATVRRLRSPGAAGPVLLHADSAYYGHAVVNAAVRAGAAVSVTVRQDRRIKAAIAAIPDDARQAIAYTDAVYDEGAGRWISRAEVAETAGLLFQGFQELSAGLLAAPAGLLADPAVLVVLGMPLALVAAALAGGRAGR